MADTGEDVKQDIAGPIQKAYDWVASKIDWNKPAGQKTDAMKSVPDDNANKKAWQESTKYTATPKLADRKPLGTAKTTKKKSSSKQTARKR